MSTSLQKFIRLTENPLKFRIFLFAKLPSAFFAGVRLKAIDGHRCVATVPYKWFSQNPFRSTYFACLGMAAELTTGALAMAHTYQHNPVISMLVTDIEGHFYKKAIEVISFVCEDGDQIKQLISETTRTGEARTFKAKSVGTNTKGEVISEFFVTWSFKAKAAVAG